MERNTLTVLVTARGFDEAALAYLREEGCTIIAPALNNTDPPADTLPGLLQGVDGWIIGSTDVSRDLIQAFPRLKVISRRGVGYEQIDIDAARELGRVVTIAVGGNAPSVADHTLGFMLAICKRLGEFTYRMRQGDWAYGVGSELFEKTVGIIGLGRIGKGVAQRLAGFEAKVLATDIVFDPDYVAARSITMVDLPTLLKQSDIVTLHAPLTDATREMLDAHAFALMKPGAILVNTARGGLVAEDALLEALKTGHIAGAGLDVFEAEKDPAHNATAAALVAHPNVMATPHTAAATNEGLARANLVAARSVVTLLRGGTLPADFIVADGRVENQGWN